MKKKLYANKFKANNSIDDENKEKIHQSCHSNKLLQYKMLKQNKSLHSFNMSKKKKKKIDIHFKYLNLHFFCFCQFSIY